MVAGVIISFLFGVLILYLVLKNMGKLPKFSKNNTEDNNNEDNTENEVSTRNITPTFSFNASLLSEPVANNTEFFGVGRVNLKVTLKVITNAFVIDSITISRKRNETAIENKTFPGPFQKNQTIIHTFNKTQDENMVGTHIIDASYINNLDNKSYTIPSKEIEIDSKMIDKAAMDEIVITKLTDVTSSQTFTVDPGYKRYQVVIKNDKNENVFDKYIDENNDYNDSGSLDTYHLRESGISNKYFLFNSGGKKLNYSGKFTRDIHDFYIINVTGEKYIFSNTESVADSDNKVVVFDGIKINDGIKTKKFFELQPKEFENALVRFEFLNMKGEAVNTSPGDSGSGGLEAAKEAAEAAVEAAVAASAAVEAAEAKLDEAKENYEDDNQSDESYLAYKKAEEELEAAEKVAAEAAVARGVAESNLAAELAKTGDVI